MTNSVAPAEYHDVFQTIRQWPPEARRDLLRDVLKTLHDERPASLDARILRGPGDPVVEIGPAGPDG